MDKQLISKYLAEAQTKVCGAVEQTMYVIERIDAERGKEAVAWMSPGKEHIEFSRADTVYGSHTLPLFLSPTIPEGMALGQKDAERYRVIRDCDHGDEAGFCAVDGQAVCGERLDEYCDKFIAANTPVPGWKPECDPALLAAAQGERK